MTLISTPSAVPAKSNALATTSAAANLKAIEAVFMVCQTFFLIFACPL
jgi:hypothetical protein